MSRSDGPDAVYPADGAWHFVRAVHTQGTVKLCLDGRQVLSLAAVTGKLQSSLTPHFGEEPYLIAFYDGLIDDVRVFSAALPCGM